MSQRSLSTPGRDEPETEAASPAPKAGARDLQEHDYSKPASAHATKTIATGAGGHLISRREFPPDLIPLPGLTETDEPRRESDAVVGASTLKKHHKADLCPSNAYSITCPQCGHIIPTTKGARVRLRAVRHSKVVRVCPYVNRPTLLALNPSADEAAFLSVVTSAPVLDDQLLSLLAARRSHSESTSAFAQLRFHAMS